MWCEGFSCCGAQALEPVGLVAPWHVESLWTGIEPRYHALAGRFVTTGPPEKSYCPEASICTNENLFFSPVNLSCMNFIISPATKTQEG